MTCVRTGNCLTWEEIRFSNFDFQSLPVAIYLYFFQSILESPRKHYCCSVSSKFIEVKETLNIQGGIIQVHKINESLNF